MWLPGAIRSRSARSPGVIKTAGQQELPGFSKHKVPLEARFGSRPHVHARLHASADMMDQAIAEGATAEEAEEMAIKQLRELGGDVSSNRGGKFKTYAVNAAIQSAFQKNRRRLQPCSEHQQLFDRKGQRP